MTDFKFGDELNFNEVPPPDHGGGTFFYGCEKCGFISSCCGFCYQKGLATCLCEDDPEIYLIGFSG